MSTIKVDTVRPVTADASLTLQGDSGGSGVTGLTIDSNGNTALGGVLKLKSSGNSITASDGTTAVLSESGGTVTLAHDTVFGTTTYGFAQLSRTANASLGNITFDISGDTTNITKPSANHIIQLGISGIYLICCTASFNLSGEERFVELSLYSGDGNIEYATSYDSIKQADSGLTYGGTSISYVGSFAADSQIYFTCASSDGANATLHDSVHASIVLLRRTS